MSKVTKELLRQLVKEEQFGSTKEIMVAIKEMFQVISFSLSWVEN